MPTSRRDKTLGALQRSSDDAAFIDELWRGGFFTDRPAELDRPAPRRGLGERAAGFLATLDVHSARADRFVRAAYRRGLRHLFHPVALAAQLILACAGGIALMAALDRGLPLELHASAGHLPLLFVVAVIAVSAHELGHAVALVHYGGSVQSAGFRLHLGTPASTSSRWMPFCSRAASA